MNFAKNAESTTGRITFFRAVSHISAVKLYMERTVHFANSTLPIIPMLLGLLLYLDYLAICVCS